MVAISQLSKLLHKTFFCFKLFCLFSTFIHTECIHPALSSSYNVQFQQSLNDSRYSDEVSTWVINDILPQDFNIKWLRNDEKQQIIKFLTKLDSSNDIGQCVKDILVIISAIVCPLKTNTKFCAQFKGKSWLSLQLIDSWPKIPAGLTKRGPFFFLGDYDICRNLIHSQNPVHYCTISGSLKKFGKIGRNLPVTAGACLPKTCNQDVFHKVIQKLRNKIYDVQSVHCARDDKAWTWKVKPAVILIIVLWLLLLVGGTLLDTSLERGWISDINEYPESLSRYADSSQEDVRLHYYARAPSVALTYKNIPTLSKITLRSVVIDIVSSFSLKKSLEFLFRNSSGDMPTLNFFKIVSAFWVILGHSCLFSLGYMDTVKIMSESMSTSSWAFSILLNSSLAVDSFLFISGAVLACSIRKRMLFSQKNIFISSRIIFFYSHRVFRLWPSLAFYLFFISVIYNHLGDGPLWNTNGIFGTQCSSFSSIWPHFLFVSNLFPSHCLPWLWYIAVDFQLYMLSPLIFLALQSKLFSNKLWIICSVVITLPLCYRFLMLLIYQLPTNFFVSMLQSESLETGEFYFRWLYANAISRSPPFFIGLFTAWIILNKSSSSLSSVRKLMGYTMIFVFLFYSLFGSRYEINLLTYHHTVIHRTTWALGLAGILYISELKYMPSLTYFLTSPRLLPLARLSFGIFLSHEPILLFLIWTSRQPLSTTSFLYFIVLAITVFSLSLICAFLLAIGIEIPLLNTERKLFKTSGTKQMYQASEGMDNCDLNSMLGNGEEVEYQNKTEMWLKNLGNPYRELFESLPPNGHIEDNEGCSLEHINQSWEKVSERSWIPFK